MLGRSIPFASIGLGAALLLQTEVKQAAGLEVCMFAGTQFRSGFYSTLRMAFGHLN